MRVLNTGRGRLADDADREQARPDRFTRQNDVPSASRGLLTLQRTIGNHAVSRLMQAAVNDTGLPDRLKDGVAHLSGVTLDDVRVHYNSDKPAQVQALAYTQGTDIHVAPGQERHLPHEAWHVVQQAQGRVRPTLRMNDGALVNNDEGLEREADVMGERALQTDDEMCANVDGRTPSTAVRQRRPAE